MQKLLPSKIIVSLVSHLLNKKKILHDVKMHYLNCLTSHCSKKEAKETVSPQVFAAIKCTSSCIFNITRKFLWMWKRFKKKKLFCCSQNRKYWRKAYNYATRRRRTNEISLRINFVPAVLDCWTKGALSSRSCQDYRFKGGKKWVLDRQAGLRECVCRKFQKGVRSNK